MCFAYCSFPAVAKIAEQAEVAAPYGHTYVNPRTKYLKSAFSSVKESLDSQIRRSMLQTKFAALKQVLATPKSTPPPHCIFIAEATAGNPSTYPSPPLLIHTMTKLIRLTIHTVLDILTHNEGTGEMGEILIPEAAAAPLSLMVGERCMWGGEAVTIIIRLSMSWVAFCIANSFHQ